MKLSELRSLLNEMDFHPSRALGQNFLIDGNILDILLDAADVRHKDTILEIGPGLGAVTEALVDSARRVVAVEKDRRLFEHLRERFKDKPKLQLICADMLEVDAEALLKTGINKVVSNLPYSAGSRILVNLAMAPAAPERIIVTVQQEVAERLAAKAGESNYSKLSVWLQLDYDIRLVKTVSPTCFWPVPEVRSEIVSFTRRRWQPLSRAERQMLYDLTTEAFTHRRKQLATIFARAEGALRRPAADTIAILGQMGLDPRARPEALSVEQWCALARACSKRY
jgi:16S rRNA (adenine1518-N6/adenine1519-N6)-dimethyltransferase